MTEHDPTSPDAEPDDDLDALLRGVFDVPDIRDEFAASLAERLDIEFQSLSTAPPEHRAADAYNSTATAPTRPAGPRTWRRISRSLLALVTLSLIITTMVWTSRSSYTWASMLQAIEGQSLVELSSGDLLQGQSADRSSRALEQRLVAFLTGVSADQSSMDDVSVLSQSWRSLNDGDQRQIQLDVMLSVGSDRLTPVHLVLTLDPDTHLPLECRIINDNAEVTSLVQFSYPVTEPVGLAGTAAPASGTGTATTSQGVRVAAVEPSESAIPATAVPADRSASTAEVNAVTDPVDEALPPAVDFTPPAPITPVVAAPAEMTRRLDRLMASFWETKGIRPTELSSDNEFFRRVYLDLTGRIPTVSEYREFQADNPIGRRQRLIEQLLSRRDHATHLAAVWRQVLLPDGVDLTPYGGTAGFEDWLTERFRDQASWDEIVSELLLAEGRVGESGPILFYTANRLEPEKLAAQTARAFLGMRLECAQCHDHFFDHRWKQEDFWGFAAFFAQISRPEGRMETISPVLNVADSERGDVTLPDSDDVIPPRYPLGEALTSESQTSPRRHQLAAWITADDNPHFARATVNRVWAHLFGRGLVEPVDDMRHDNPAVCPEVLDELAGYLIAGGFDLRDLFRVIVSSETYQRTSHSVVDDPTRTSCFAQMNVKSFTAEQLYDSIAVATQLETPSTLDGSLMRAENTDRQAFLDQFRTPPGQVTDYQSGIPQALMLMNGRLVQSATGLQTSGLMRSLQAPFFSDEQRIEILYLAALARSPDTEEQQAMLEYVLTDNDDREQRLQDILWALLNSAEFTLNH